jgi:hypothetical protein
MTAAALSRYDNPARLSAEDRAAITLRGTAAARRVAERYGVRVDAPVVLAERYALRVHLRPAPLVARVSTLTAVLRHPIESWLARELDVTRFLSGRGAPVVAPSDLLPAGPHVEDGLAISFWTYVEPLEGEVPTPDETGQMLAVLHAALREYPGELPRLAPPFTDIPRGLARLARLPDVLPAADLAMLHRAAERLLPAVEPFMTDLQPLHGDAHAYNLIRTRQGLLWNDFEDTCLGPVAWDLVSFTDPEDRLPRAYGVVPPPETREAFQRLRLLQGVVWVLALQPELDEFASYTAGMLDTLRALD